MSRAGRRRAAWIVAALVVAGAGAAAVLARRPGVLRPNVLLLVLDTTRADRCSLLGYDRPTTPRLAEFAKDAVVFRDAWTPAGWTGPAHASLFTALRPEHHGFQPGRRMFLWERPTTMAERFSAGGWSTACFSNNEFVSPAFGLARGFAKFEAMYVQGAVPGSNARQTHDSAAAWAEEESRAGRPFLLFINDMEPHMPYTPPADARARLVRAEATPAEVDRVVDWTRSRMTIPNPTGEGPPGAGAAGVLSDLYDAEIAGLDHEVGVLLDRLAADGLLETTIVVIVGDHGESLGEHGLFGHCVGMRSDMHRVIRHVPLVVRWPGKFDGGRTVDSVVRLEDVAPTLLELCGLPPLPDADGAPLTHDVEGRVARGMLGEGPSEGPARAGGPAKFVGVECVYDGRRHFLAYTDGTTELYDAADPLENDDLARREPQEVARLSSLLSVAR